MQEMKKISASFITIKPHLKIQHLQTEMFDYNGYFSTPDSLPHTVMLRDKMKYISNFYITTKASYFWIYLHWKNFDIDIVICGLK